MLEPLSIFSKRFFFFLYAMATNGSTGPLSLPRPWDFHLHTENNVTLYTRASYSRELAMYIGMADGGCSDKTRFAWVSVLPVQVCSLQKRERGRTSIAGGSH